MKCYRKGGTPKGVLGAIHAENGQGEPTLYKLAHPGRFQSFQCIQRVLRGRSAKGSQRSAPRWHGPMSRIERHKRIARNEPCERHDPLYRCINSFYI